MSKLAYLNIIYQRSRQLFTYSYISYLRYWNIRLNNVKVSLEPKDHRLCPKYIWIDIIWSVYFSGNSRPLHFLIRELTFNNVWYFFIMKEKKIYIIFLKMQGCGGEAGRRLRRRGLLESLEADAEASKIHLRLQKVFESFIFNVKSIWNYLGEFFSNPCQERSIRGSGGGDFCSSQW